MKVKVIFPTNLYSGIPPFRASVFFIILDPCTASALEEIPFKLNSNQFEFDTQILIQFSIAKKKIYEIPIPTFYGKEFSSLVWYKYGFAILNTTIVYYLQRFGIFYDKKFNFVRGKSDNYESEKKD